MADILIRGIEMPTNRDVTIRIDTNGEVYVYDTYPTLILKAVTLPEGHGRIVDAAEILKKANNSPWFDGDVAELGLLLGSEVATILPAEGGTDDD